mmetsp:Transcript_12053/g.26700  ORF Transcript_12053/g.26700 Transcript_12053/m.26700 type:complete len:710 (+) Transcript_12053:100-2229(+)|eukprot:CAMPEP_0204257646 /NCGR_PEP_ID=MMETSP0468-20130131/4560_1 /ASSEMBLY_ACC=CAM_ASM_000383 /TAXON_ID=2969 /ORGANISM="Oxyrrhis marina" /LENGTH=709 /DNA_ID=CAMNT_0051231793 /DNA_START=97 /DNA_END=2226 /DNA_ORIENTATION=+
MKIVICIAAGVTAQAPGPAPAALATREPVSCKDGNGGPVCKVIDLLEKLQAQTELEGHNEAQTYEKLACFCKDKTTEKSDAIEKGAAMVTSLKGTLADLVSRRDTKAGDVKTNQGDIQQTQKDIEDSKASFESFKSTHKTNHVDMSEALKSLEEAIKLLVAKRDANKRTVESNSDDAEALLQRAATHARAAGAAVPAAELAALQATTKIGNLDAIIDQLKEMKKGFVTGVQDHEKEFIEKKKTHNAEVQGYVGSLDALKVTLQDNQKQLSDLQSDIAQNNKDLTRAQASLVDDQQYLQELTGKCEKKAKAWDQRAMTRSQELSAITEALAIIKGTVLQKDGVNQQGAGARVLLSGEEQVDMDQQEAEALHPASFVQIHKSFMSQRVVAEPARAKKVVALLRQKAQLLNSKVLSSLADKAAADPFAKVKKLIQDMIERLLSEAGEDAEHKGWCDTEMGKSKQKRNYQQDKTALATQEIHELEAEKNKLTAAKSQLDKEIEELNNALATAIEERAAEKSQNDQDVADAKTGKVAVEKATKVLSDFYAKAKKNAALTQQSPVDEDMPDGFDDDASDGNQEAGTGIIGMLEVIAGDFARTIKETTIAENQALRDFVDFKRVTNASLAKKTDEKEHTETDLRTTKTSLGDKVDELKEAQGLLNAAVVELMKLKPACVDLGKVDAAERKANREQEIEALKEALCILADPTGAASC